MDTRHTLAFLQDRERFDCFELVEFGLGLTETKQADHEVAPDFGKVGEEMIMHSDYRHSNLTEFPSNILPANLGPSVCR